MSSLAVYYSLEGSTKLIAENVASVLGADILDLKSVKEEVNPKSFLKFFRGGRQVFQKKKPELAPYERDISRYDTLIKGNAGLGF